jgi:hypothetical protein
MGVEDGVEDEHLQRSEANEGTQEAEPREALHDNA